MKFILPLLITTSILFTACNSQTIKEAEENKKSDSLLIELKKINQQLDSVKIKNDSMYKHFDSTKN